MSQHAIVTGEAPAVANAFSRLPTPAELRAEVPLRAATGMRIAGQRQAVRDILAGRDDRLLVICGPCSIHDVGAAYEYAQRLAELTADLRDVIYPVMRVYVEKPRTTVGWKGLLHDPGLDGSGDLARGLTASRTLMRDIADTGLAVATELLSPAAVDYLSDTLAWAAVGARTTESQTHRERMSSLDVPVGFKNATSGAIGPACDAIAAAAAPQRYFGQDADGRPAVIESPGNPDGHLILRGGTAGPNYGAADVAAAVDALARAGQNTRLVVDCSHANSAKTAARQPAVLADLVGRRVAGERAIAGVMLESHLVHGKQALGDTRGDTQGDTLCYGQSVTDDCLGFDATAQALCEAARALRQSGVSLPASSVKSPLASS
ncbi:3-deoxy-7-phosphoheptulonate synthase [uncultured Salinisphaera sp.]|uniref:3-deoxy-7-phosphoheptulonate synthase n=1 Tax=uncultured Salinisphaera sp. TaxID=359372 RepID=UPI0032B30344|tara:strand:- start:6532 stop:7662 length:1131 start_codon:yes stop_codon:yes gene_type:complete